MLRQHSAPGRRARLQNAKRFFSLVPLLVFLLALMLFSSLDRHSYIGFLHALLLSVTVTLASSFISIAAYWFYRYLNERSPGL